VAIGSASPDRVAETWTQPLAYRISRSAVTAGSCDRRYSAAWRRFIGVLLRVVKPPSTADSFDVALVVVLP
jgi:hypothetical protein